MVYNPYIVVPFATWAVSQVSKFAIEALKGKIDWRYLYASGGMPSVHSAVVCSLATTSLLVSGAGSPLFGFTAIFAAIVMYDSFGVRRSAGEQAAAINMLVESLDRSKVRLSEPRLHLREILGHQPKEVTVGAVVGVVLGGLFNYNHLGWLWTYVQIVPHHLELLTYGLLFGLLIVGGWIVRLILRLKFPKSKAVRQLGRRIITLTQIVGWLGALTVLFVYENANYLSWRLWPELLLIIGLVWAVTLVVVSYQSVPAAIAAEASEARKLKWLRWGRDRRKTR